MTLFRHYIIIILGQNQLSANSPEKVVYLCSLIIYCSLFSNRCHYVPAECASEVPQHLRLESVLGHNKRLSNFWLGFSPCVKIVTHKKSAPTYVLYMQMLFHLSLNCEAVEDKNSQLHYTPAI